MFTLGGTELLLVGVLVLLLFGPEKLPQFARTLGRFMREFNKYKDIMESTFRMEMEAAEKAEAVRTAAENGEEPPDGLDKLKQAAAASREFAAERGLEMPEAADLGIGVSATGSETDAAAEEAPAIAARVTDEDEEEG